MSDFLKNLRNTQRRSPPKPTGPGRKEPGERYSMGNERRAMPDRRTPFPPQSQYRESREANEYLPVIKKNLDSIASSLERMVENQESLSHAQIKQHESVTAFFKTFNQIMVEKIVPILNTLNLDTVNLNVANPDSSNLEMPIKKSSTSYARGTHYTKDDIIEMIRSMRKQRSTYDEIAQGLMEKGIPTFSGRGKWHAQTIHRLCKSKTS